MILILLDYYSMFESYCQNILRNIVVIIMRSIILFFTIVHAGSCFKKLIFPNSDFFFEFGCLVYVWFYDQNFLYKSITF
jgi:hypothetical protein